MFVFKIENWKNLNKQAYFDYMLWIKDWEYIIKEYKKTRSNDQNRYYWALIDILYKETWVEKEEIHEKMRMKFLVVNSWWKSLPYCRSTTKLTKEEFWFYIENIKNFFAELLWMILPSADEFENFIK